MRYSSNIVYGQTRRVILATVVRNIGRISAGFVNEMIVISICPARDGYDTYNILYCLPRRRRYYDTML